MFHAKCKPRYHESLDASAIEPCSKKMKSTEEPYGKSYDGLQRLYEEIHVKKTHSGFIPLSLSDDEEVQQEHEVLDPFKEKFSDKKPMSSEPSDSVSNMEVTGKKCPFFTDNADVVNIGEKSFGERKYEKETEVYSTSKAFIGPIYKTEADKKNLDSNCQKVSNAALGRNSKKDMLPKQTPLFVPKIEDELSQFYSEIDQLESDKNQLDGHLEEAEADSPRQPVEYNKWNQKACVNSQNWTCSRTLPNFGRDNCFYNESSDHRIQREQYPYHDLKDLRTGNGQCFDSERKAREAEQLCNKQADSRFWNDSVPPFRPGWQHTHPLIPYTPLPPQFTPHFNFQDPNFSSHQSHTFHPSNVGPFENTHINMSSSASDQSSEHACRFDIPNTQTTRNGYNVPDGHIGNGFCETKTCWKDMTSYPTEGSGKASQPFPEDKLFESQKLLLILRGLPGSGKTTLSRILLGQSHNGIVFSTDDYFHQQDGCWSYNVGQLGTAHEWNQKRAKQAMDQGRSPIIIDNTNTQAWEMKPYVEVALEKGYKVEFHEPNTWWKFDPEELEKRNEHGVSREKIIQMLERYDYQISIPVVMNSMLPFHKTSQRPPPQRRQREAEVKKRHRLHKVKQRRKRKRNRKIKCAAIKAMEKNPSAHLTHHSEEDSSQSGGEDSEDDGKSAFVIGHSNELKEGGEDGSINDDVLKPELQKGNFFVSDLVDPQTVDNSLKNCVLAEGSRMSLSLPCVPNENITKQSLSDKIKSKMFAESKNNTSECNHQSSALKFEYTNTEMSTLLSNMEDKDTFTKTIPESGAESTLSDNKREAGIYSEHKTSKKNEINTWAFFSFDLADSQDHDNLDKNESCLTWPEGPSKVMIEQRTKKVRRSKQWCCGGSARVFSERTAEQTDYKSEELEQEGDGEELHRTNCVTDSVLPLSQTENTYKMPCIETSDFPSECVTKAPVSSDVSIHPNNVNTYSSRKKGRCRRIFKLAPNFDLPRQVVVEKDEKTLKDVDLLMQQEKIANEETKENKQSLCCHEFPALISYDVIVESSPHLDVECVTCNVSNQIAEESRESTKEVVTSPVKISTLVSCKNPLASEGQIVEFDQKVQVNMAEKRGSISLDVSTAQPDILHSVKLTVECLADFAAENSEQMQQITETEPTKYSKTGDDQDCLSTKPNFLGLPLSLGFALRLVELFGSPGVPLDTLLPDDYVVPLDWATSKEIHLQWKTSVEKKQKNNRTKEDNSLHECPQFWLHHGFTFHLTASNNKCKQW